MKRLGGLFAALVAVAAAGAPTHVPSTKVTAAFSRAAVVAPAVWLPELDAGLPLSTATVFASDHDGVPIAFALDGGSVPLTITYDAGAQRDPRQIGDWVPITNLAVGYNIGVGSGLRSVVTTGAYRLFVYDGASKLDDVTRHIHLGSTQATAMDPGGFIYTGYALGGDVDRYSLESYQDGVGYNITAQRPQKTFPGSPTALAGVPESRSLLVGVSRNAVVSVGSLMMVDKDLQTLPSELEGTDAGRIGLTVDGVAVYHAKAAGEDYALVSSDGRLFLYRVKPTFAFVQELIIDGASAGPYFTGIALSNLALGTYDKGLVVVANIYTPSGGTSGELLYVRWDDLVSAVDAGLAIDTAFDIRTLAGSPPLGGGDGGSLDGGSAVGPIGPGIPVASSGGCGATGGTSLALAGMLFAVVSLSRRRR